MKNIKIYLTVTLIALISLSSLSVINNPNITIANRNILQEKLQANILPEVLVIGKRIPILLSEVVVTAKRKKTIVSLN